MIIQFTYTGHGIASIKPGDKLNYDTERRPIPTDLVVADINGEFRVLRWQSTMRKKRDFFVLKGVIVFI